MSTSLSVRLSTSPVGSGVRALFRPRTGSDGRTVARRGRGGARELDFVRTKEEVIG